MIVLNFSHPLTSDQVAQIELMVGESVERIVEVPSHFDESNSFGPQVTELADRCELSPVEWQALTLAVVPPALNYIAVALMAELHGRMGYFPTCVRLRPVEGARPPRFEVAELMNLQEMRKNARQRR